LSVKPKEFDQATAFAAEGKQGAAEGIFRQSLLGQHCQIVDALAPSQPTSCHHRRIVCTAKAEVSWFIPTPTQPALEAIS
jgi:hypothetical protein